MTDGDKLLRICSKLIKKACEIRNGTIGSEYAELNTLRTMRAVMYEDLAQIIRSVAPEPRKPREIRLVYKGSGTWREWMHEDGPCLDKSVLFREVEINEIIN